MSVGSLSLSNAISLTPPQLLRTDDPAFADIQRRLQETRQKFDAARAAESDPAAIARNRAVQADAVIRLNGHIAGIVWRDGTTESTSEIPSFSDFAKSLGNVSTQQALDAYTQQLEQTYGGSATVERYDGSANAPARGDYIDGTLFTQADYAFGRRVAVTV